MTTPITLGSTVTAPVTDKDGEEGFVIGKLIGLNKRMAKIETSDGEIINVGKTKIELVKGKKSTKKAVKDGDDEPTGRIADGYVYKACVAASGRKSCDNNDDIAKQLRGMPLDEAYKTVSRAIGVPLAELVNKYSHLNFGQQRMCIGNRLRGFLSNQ